MPTPEMNSSPAMASPSKGPSRGVAGVVLTYALFAGLWILVSDGVVEWLFSDPAAIIRASILKGVLFVAVTSLLLYGLVRRRFNQFMALVAREQQVQAEKLHALGLLAAIAEGSDDAIFAKDTVGRYTLFNPAASRFVGKPVAEVLGRDDREIFPPEQAQRLMAFDRKLLAEQRILSQEEILDTPEGTRHFLTTKGPLKDGEGAVVGTFGISRDISERKRVEAALKDSEERYRMAFRTSPDAININRCADGCYLDVNDGFERMTGWRRAQVVGHSSLAIGIWHDPADRLRLLQMLSRDGYCENLEADFVMNDGTIRHGLMSAHIIQLSGEACILSITRDITEKTQAEAALRESEARYRSVVDNIKEVIFQTDAQGLWTFLNPAWAEVTGFSVAESLGRLFLDYVLPEDRQRNAELFEPLVQRRKDECHHEIRYVHKEGGYRWIEVCARLTLDDQGVIIGTSGTLSDITERRAAADSLRRQAEELALRNEELERFNRATVGRELDMIALKRQVNELARELGREPPFSLSFLDDSAPVPATSKH